MEWKLDNNMFRINGDVVQNRYNVKHELLGFWGGLRVTKKFI